MAIVTQIINGYLADSSGNPLSSGFVRFSLSRYDTSSNGVISSYKDTDAPIQTDGSILQELWPNSRGSDGTYYHVLLLDDKRKVKESLGIIRVEEAGPYELSDLIEAQSTGGEPTLYRVMTKAEYDAVIAAASTATSAASAAESARDDAQQIAYGTDPVFNTAKVTNDLTVDGVIKGAAVQSSAVDAGVGKLMLNGGHGLGINNPPGFGGNFQNASITGFRSGTSQTETNAPPGAINQYMAMALSANANNTAILGYFRGSPSRWAAISQVAGAWDAWETFYTTNNLVGTVSDAGGKPNGGAMNEGSNANGKWARLASGLQICWNDNAAIVTAPAAFVGTVTKSTDNKIWLGRWK